jgi:hypothetical protein
VCPHERDDSTAKHERGEITARALWIGAGVLSLGDGERRPPDVEVDVERDVRPERERDAMLRSITGQKAENIAASPRSLLRLLRRTG